MPGGERYLLEELPEEKVAQYFIKGDRAARGRGRLYRDDLRHWIFGYREEGLYHARFTSSDSIPVAFSVTKEGPYVKLPITRRTMVEMFGEPVKWGSYRPASGP